MAIDHKITAAPWPVGATVSLYSRRGDQPVLELAAPPGASLVASSTVAGDGSVTFTGLPEDTQFTATGQDPAGAWRWVKFRTALAPSGLIPGPQGPAGIQGVQGPTGPTGPAGPNGTNAPVPQLVTTLPVSPTDGLEVYFQADPANGVIWHLRYRAASGSSYKWEFVGGGELLQSFNGNTAAASVSSLTQAVPLAGDYVIETGIRAQSNLYPFAARIRVLDPSSVAIGGDAAWVASDSSGGGGTARYSATAKSRQTLTATGTYAGDIDDLGNNPNVFQAYMSFRPVRVG